MLCPRCQLLLTDDQYENQHVKFCTNCWGHWLDQSALDAILKSDSYSFSPKERKEMLATWATRGDVDRQGAESEPIDCPECNSRLHRKQFFDACPVEVDVCDEHGIWLDTGEIKELQIFFESDDHNH